MFHPRPLLLAGVGIILISCKTDSTPANRKPWDPAPSFWVWNQTTKPPDGPHYLQMAEFTRDSIKILQEQLPSPNHTAVVRLPPGRETLDDPALLKRLISYLKEKSFPRLQLDYDCASLNLRLYRSFLEDLKTQVGPSFLSVTALAGWIEAPDFESLALAVDELAPMFYDLESDAPAQILAHSPLPLTNEDTLAWIRKWSSCPTSWKAGLPNYQRLSLFEASGELVGHLQRWSPSDLRELRGLTPVESRSPNSLIHHIETGQVYQRVGLGKGQWLVWRAPSEPVMREAIQVAENSGASGVIWFAHPDSTPVTWHSIPHLTTLAKGVSPKPDLRTIFGKDGSVTLTNHGAGDLISLPQGPTGVLSLESPVPGTFAASGPGQFIKVSAPGSSLTRPELARTIHLEFANLRSGESLTSEPGLISNSKESRPSARIHFESP